MSLNPEDLMPVAVNIYVPLPPSTVSTAEPNRENMAPDLATSMASLSIAPGEPSTTRKGRIIVHCIRHAESFCNLSNLPDVHLMPDPGLTDEGVIQSEELLEQISESKRIDNIDFILSSPLERALQTAMIAFEPALAERLKIIAYPDLRENGNIPSGTGASLENLKMYENMVDLGLVESGWETKYERRSHLRDGRERDARVRKEVWKLGTAAMKETAGKWKHLDVGGREGGDRDVEIVVVTHGGFLDELVDIKGKHFYNSECRSYVLSQVISRNGKVTHRLEDLPESEQLAPLLKDDVP